VKKSEHFYIEFCQNMVLQQIPVFSQLLDENKTRYIEHLAGRHQKQQVTIKTFCIKHSSGLEW